MKVYKLGEKSRMLCPVCRQLRTTTFRERDVPLSSGEGIVRDVLVGVCDHCDEVVSLPLQSVPRVKETIQSARHAVEARIPRHLHDIVNLVCVELGGSLDGAQLLFRYYLRRLVSQKALQVHHILTLASSEEASGTANARFSAKLNDRLYLDWKELTAQHKKADVVKGMIVQMKHDVLDQKKPEIRKELRTVLELS